MSILLNITLFVDDTNMHFVTRLGTLWIQYVQLITNYKKVDIWFRVNKVSLNVNKTDAIMFENKTNNSIHHFEWNEHCAGVTYNIPCSKL